MKKNTGADELQKAITAKQAEIEAIAGEIKAAAGDAAATVAAEKKDRRARAELAALETAHRAATYTPPEPTDRQELLQGLEKYEAEHKARIDKIKAEIAAADKEAAEVGQGLQEAAEAADTKKTISLSGRKEEIEATKGHLLEMLQRAESLPVYPAGAIDEEWAALCARLLPEYENRLAEVKTLAEAYKAAADSLLQMQDAIMDARAEMSKRGKDGAQLPTIFTKDRTAEGLTIEPTYKARISYMFAPIVGRAI